MKDLEKMINEYISFEMGIPFRRFSETRSFFDIYTNNEKRTLFEIQHKYHRIFINYFIYNNLKNMFLLSELETQNKLLLWMNSFLPSVTLSMWIHPLGTGESSYYWYNLFK